MEKRLVFIRHAHRDTSDRDADNGLSEKGWDQAHALAQEFVSSFKDQKPVLLSSARMRCVETLEPIAKLTGVKIKISPLLIEQEHDESFREMAARVETFLEDWKESTAELTLACSHGDWLPVALDELVDEQIEMKKGAWAEVIWKGSKAKLSRVIQKPQKE